MAANPVPLPSKTLTIDVRLGEDGAPVLTCRGRINGETSGLFKSEVKKLVPEHKRIVADLSSVEYVDSSGLGAILATYISAKSSGADLKLINLSQRVSDLLRLTKLASVFEGYGEYL